MKEEKQIIPEIKIKEALELKTILNTDFSEYSDVKEWPMEEDFQGSVLNDVRLTKIEWKFNGPHGILSLRLTLSNGKVSPILGN